MKFCYCIIQDSLSCAEISLLQHKKSSLVGGFKNYLFRNEFPKGPPCLSISNFYIILGKGRGDDKICKGGHPYP